MPDMTHVMAGVSFPARVGPWVRGDLTQGDEFGHNLWIGYGGVGALDGVQVTAYVYPDDRGGDEFQVLIEQISAAHQNAVVRSHGHQTLAGMKGLWTIIDLDNARSGLPARVPSWAWLFKSDGWCVKYRCTNWTGATAEDVENAMRALATTISAPNTTTRIAERRAEAFALSQASMSKLQNWRPTVDPHAEANLRRADDLRAQGRFQEAIALLTETIRSLPPRGLQAELGRLHLLSGDLVDATEACMAEEEEETGEEHALAAALGFFVPDVAYGGGWGTSPASAVITRCASTASVAVASSHRFLEFALGVRGTDWKLDSTCLIAHEGRLYDAMRTVLASGNHVTVFFQVDSSDFDSSIQDQTLGCFVAGGSVRGQINLAGPNAEFVMRHLMEHSCQTLLTAHSETS